MKRPALLLIPVAAAVVYGGYRGVLYVKGKLDQASRDLAASRESLQDVARSAAQVERAAAPAADLAAMAQGVDLGQAQAIANQFGVRF